MAKMWGDPELVREEEDLVSLEKALRYSRACNQLLIGILRQRMAEEGIAGCETLIFERPNGELWELEVADAVPTEQGVRLMGEAVRVQ